MNVVEWRPIPGWPYEASALGHVRRIGSEPPMRPHEWRTGYLQVGLWVNGRGHTKWVHRLVCAAFHGAAPSARMDVAHANGDKKDNRPENLRWATRAENENDKRRHGRDNAGSRNGQAKLTEGQVAEILGRIGQLRRSSGGRRLRKGELPRLAEEYAVTPAAIRNILSGTHWRHIRVPVQAG